MISVRVLTALSIVLFVFLAASCEKKESITIDGSTTVLPVISQIADEFRARHPDINLVINAGGSGVGISQVGSGRLQIGMISRDLTPDEIRRFPQTEFVTHVVGGDAVVPVVSRAVYDAGVTALSFDQLRRIYSGELQNWSEVGGPDREILVIDKEKSRGTRHVFMKAIAGDPQADAPGADLVLGANNELQTAITQSNSALGMLSHAWINDDVKGLTIITKDGEQIKPTQENIERGIYPIIRNIELLTRGEPSGNVKTFIDFALGERGQQIVEQTGYARIVQQ